MVGLKNIQMRVVGMITDEMHPYTFFMDVGMHLVCYHPYYPCL